MSATADFNSSLFGCFANPKLSILTCCAPCYTIGRNAEVGLQDDCLLIALLYAVGINFGPIVRYRLREKKNIQGSMITDVLVHALLPCCALVQEANEVGWTMPKTLADAGKRETSPEMQRQ